MSNIVSRFCQTAIRLDSQTAVKRKINGKWRSHSWREYHEKVESLAYGLKSLGFNKGDRLAIISDTRFEWAATDLACLGLGGVLVPIYASNSKEDIEYILNNCGAKVLVIENPKLLEKFQQVATQCKKVEKVVLIDTLDNTEYESWESIQQKAEEGFLAQQAEQVSIDDIASIVYTSGTTGKPKGVVLSHKQIMSEITDAFDVFNVTQDDVSLSFLPFSHIFGRCEHWGHAYVGFLMAYAENIESLRDNLVEIQPTFLVAVPRIFEKIYNGVISAAEASPIKHRLFLWALDLGKKVSWHKQYKEQIPMKVLLEYKLAQKLVFSKLMEKLGGKVRFAVSGGAPLNGDIAEFFHAAGLLILEGYGLTETCAAVSLNTHLEYKFGSVGIPLGNSEFKLAEDGELLVKSDKVMIEYYNNPEATKETFTEDGFFKTGDVAQIDDKGFVTITDRKKDLIKTAGGKYVAPQKLEKLLKSSKYISNVLIHGDKKKYIVALVTLEEEEILKFAKEKQIEYGSFKELVDKNEIYQLIRRHVAEVNLDLASYESIKAFHILDHDFTIEGGQLTPSLKVKRKHCDNLYTEQIQKLFGNEASQNVSY